LEAAGAGLEAALAGLVLSSLLVALSAFFSAGKVVADVER